MTDRIWILGAPDPEMAAIERLLRECWERVEYALDASGERVSPATAYKAVKTSAEVPADATVYLVECGVDGITNEVVRIDHHRPGDPGYGRPPAEFLSASSIGQTIEFLAHTKTTSNMFDYDVVLDNAQWSRIEAGTHHDHTMSWGCDDDRIPDVEVDRFSDLGDPLPTVVRLLEQPWPMPFAWVAEIGAYIICTPRGGFELGGSESWHVVPRELVLAAAADHCLAAAYRGECPGVDPDVLMRWRAETRARHQGRSVEDVLVDIARAQEALRGAPCVYLVDDDRCCGAHRLGDGVFVDHQCCEPRTRMPHVADMRGRVIPELPEAATRLGVGYIAGPLEGPDGRRKITCSGSAEQVRAFLEHWAPREGLTDLYGDPARGFAGGLANTGPTSLAVNATGKRKKGFTTRPKEPKDKKPFLAVVIEPGKKPEIRDIGDAKLETIQALVGGYIEHVPFFPKPYTVAVNEGTIVIYKTKSLTQEDAEKIVEEWSR